jgi:hypothetical protein
MMSHYRDLLVAGERQKINFVLAHTKDNHSALHMYFLGTHGPFGNLFYDNISTLPFKFLDRPIRSISFQPNTWDCGLCWCLFIYDTMLAFHHRAYMIAPVGKEDTSHYLGHFIHSKDFMDGKRSINLEKKMVTIPLCKLWRFEMLETIERLRWCYLSSRHCDITRPNDWGATTADHQTLISGQPFIDNVLPVINIRVEKTRPKINGVYLKEKKARMMVTDGKKFPSIDQQPILLLDIKRYAALLENEVMPTGLFGSKAWVLPTIARPLPAEESDVSEHDFCFIENAKKR